MIQRRDFLKGGAAALMYGAGYVSFPQTSKAGSAVTFDERSLIVNGRRMLISCGEIHYPRSTRAMWPVILERSKALGLNTIATYVFWNLHETSRGVFNFTGERDLGHYLDLCKQNGLAVFLRVGPYICAEWNYGGFPPYLRDESGITIRTMNPAYTARVETYFHRLAEVVKPHLASNGGPVVMVQVENEYTNVYKRYGAEGQEYLRWIIDLATRVGFASVPTTTCEGGAQGAIETSNGFMISPERIAAVRKTHPGTPLLWTELYPAWYRVWGGRIAPARDPKSMAGSILDFVSRGGSGWNYYPWHGGTNFGRSSMYLQTPTYDFHAPLDEFGSVTESGVYLGRFHAVLEEHRTTLLEGDRTEETVDGTRTTTWRHGQDELHLVQDKNEEKSTDRGPFRMRNDHARLTTSKGEILFDLDTIHEAVARSFSEPVWKPVLRDGLQASAWQSWDEPLPVQRPDIGMASIEPIEQLSLTKDTTDYCWYSATLQVDESGPQEIVIPYGGDFFYAYVDGELIGSSKLPLKEDRGPITPDDPAHPRIVANDSEKGHDHDFQHSFTLPALSVGPHRLDLLAVALGMIKGDWQIASSMDFERKGIWEGVRWNGKPLQNWTMRPGLLGEQHQIVTAQEKVSWAVTNGKRPLRWYKTQVDIPEALLRGRAVFRLDAQGLGKGMIWINGHSLGRHWLIQASGPPDTPSQRYYHIPADWLGSKNRVVILEEQANSPENIQLEVRA